MSRLPGRTRFALACHGLLDLVVGSWFLFAALFLAAVLFLALTGHWQIGPLLERVLVTILISLFFLGFGTASVGLLLRSGSLLWSAVIDDRPQIAVIVRRQTHDNSETLEDSTSRDRTTFIIDQVRT
jgi:hypothetical protein